MIILKKILSQRVAQQIQIYSIELGLTEITVTLYMLSEEGIVTWKVAPHSSSSLARTAVTLFFGFS